MYSVVNDETTGGGVRACNLTERATVMVYISEWKGHVLFEIKNNDNEKVTLLLFRVTFYDKVFKVLLLVKNLIKLMKKTN